MTAPRQRRRGTARAAPVAAPPAAWPAWAPAALIVLLTVVAYIPALQGGFIWDDDDYVTDNLLLRLPGGLARMWFEPGATPQYYPLTFTTFWIEYRLWGLTPAGYHAVNVLLHGLSAVLLWRALVLLQVPGGWFAAALFAVHPVQVESVAWITERKNTLSGAFTLAALLAYLHFALDRGRRRWRLYGVALACFVAALLSKTVAASLPAVLVLLLWWKRGRLDAPTLAPLLPLFALGLAFGLTTAWVEKRHVGAVGADWDLSLVERALIAGRALWFYAGKLAWPQPLIFFYPRWSIDAAAWWQYLFPLAAVGAIAALFLWRARLGRGPLVAVLCFAGVVAPALGFIDVFPMRYSFVADHFQYLASAALLTLAAAAAAQSTAGLPTAARRGAAAVVLAVLMLLTWRQGGVYRDLETLWRDTIAKNPAAWMAHNNLGLLLAARGDAAAATAHYRAALAAKPDDAFAYNNLGHVLASQGRMDDAITQFEAALRAEPGNAEARSNLGNAFASQGRLDEAVAAYAAALQLRPRYPEAHNNLANVLAMLGRRDEAIAHYRAALEIDPGYGDARGNLETLLGEGR